MLVRRRVRGGWVYLGDEVLGALGVRDGEENFTGEYDYEDIGG